MGCFYQPTKPARPPQKKQKDDEDNVPADTVEGSIKDGNTCTYVP